MFRICVYLVFEYVESFITTSTEVELDWFSEFMFSNFETKVYPTFGVNHVQFIKYRQILYVNASVSVHPSVSSSLSYSNE